jgi:hypothetical protein
VCRAAHTNRNTFFNNGDPLINTVNLKPLTREELDLQEAVEDELEQEAEQEAEQPEEDNQELDSNTDNNNKSIKEILLEILEKLDNINITDNNNTETDNTEILDFINKQNLFNKVVLNKLDKIIKTFT